MEVEKKQTSVDSLIEQLLPFIDRTKVSDTMIQNIVEEHLLMEQEQRKEIYELGYQDGSKIVYGTKEWEYGKSFPDIRK